MKENIKIIGKSNSIKELKEKIQQIASAKATVLITGESGTGKELVAQMLHTESKRARANFVPINCGAIPSELLESELFGHEKGAFTGAVTPRMGRFEIANNGTIFLDEISEMPFFMQVKLLRVIQEQCLERLGSSKQIQVNTRIIAATNKNLEDLVMQNKFREDLFYRLNVVPLSITPLRERLEDLPLLIEYFQNEIENREGLRSKFTDEVLKYFYDYSWPGNVRELYNIVERITVLYPNQEVKVSHIPQKIKVNAKVSKISSLTETVIESPYEISDDFSLKDKIVEVESNYIKKALSEHNGVVAQAANALGIRRTTLVEKLKKLDIDPKSLKEA